MHRLSKIFLEELQSYVICRYHLTDPFSEFLETWKLYETGARGERRKTCFRKVVFAFFLTENIILTFSEHEPLNELWKHNYLHKTCLEGVKTNTTHKKPCKKSKQEVHLSPTLLGTSHARNFLIITGFFLMVRFHSVLITQKQKPYFPHMVCFKKRTSEDLHIYT